MADFLGGQHPKGISHPSATSSSWLTEKQIAETLPKLELNALNSGSYYINLHIITGRKPHQPRPGDILLDGSREGMTDSKQDSMTRYTKLSLTTSWERHSKYTS